MWLTITISGLSPPGSAQTGWDGGDGRTILVAGIAGVIASVAVLFGLHDLWVKVVLLISGAIAAIIAIVNMVDAGSKAHDIQMQFGIPAGDVKAQIGIGLYLVVIGGAGLVGGRTPYEDEPFVTSPVSSRDAGESHRSGHGVVPDPRLPRRRDGAVRHGAGVARPSQPGATPRRRGT